MKRLLLALLAVLISASFAIADDFNLGSPTYPLPQATKIRVIVNTITPTNINYTITWIDASNNEIITKFLALEGQLRVS